jgi:hypothetical protein
MPSQRERVMQKEERDVTRKGRISVSRVVDA